MTTPPIVHWATLTKDEAIFSDVLTEDEAILSKDGAILSKDEAIFSDPLTAAAEAVAADSDIPRRISLVAFCKQLEEAASSPILVTSDTNLEADGESVVMVGVVGAASFLKIEIAASSSFSGAYTLASVPSSEDRMPPAVEAKASFWERGGSSCRRRGVFAVASRGWVFTPRGSPPREGHLRCLPGREDHLVAAGEIEEHRSPPP